MPHAQPISSHSLTPLLSLTSRWIYWSMNRACEFEERKKLAKKKKPNSFKTLRIAQWQFVELIESKRLALLFFHTYYVITYAFQRKHFDFIFLETITTAASAGVLKERFCVSLLLQRLSSQLLLPLALSICFFRPSSIEMSIFRMRMCEWII